MRWPRFLLILAVIGALVPLSRYLTGPALSLAPDAGLQGTPEPEAPPLPEITKPDATATRTLEKAIDNLSEERVPWLDTKFWQKVRHPDLSYEGEAHYQSAPGHRYRLEIHTHVSDLEGIFLMVCNGTDVWAGSRIGSEEWTIATRIGLQEILDMLAGPTISPRLRNEFLEGETFSGVLPLLRNLYHQLSWVRAETLEQPSGMVVRLTGVWSAEHRAAHAPAGKPWPASLSRLCRLSLDARSLLPVRVEWWGPRTLGGKDGLLAEMEFRSITTNHALTDKECDELFSFDPGKTKVVDQTLRVQKQLLVRNRELLEVKKK